MPPCLRAAQTPRECRDEKRGRCESVACPLDKLDPRLDMALFPGCTEGCSRSSRHSLTTHSALRKVSM